MKKLFLISAVFMVSCQLIVDVDVPYPGDKIVANAIQVPDSVWTVDLTQTKYILDAWTRFVPINFADVVIHKPDGTTEILVGDGDGRYKGTTYPEAGKTYKITVNRDGLDPTEGEMTMPSFVKIENIVWDSAHMVEGDHFGGRHTADVPYTITFTDPPGENNYYDVNVYMYTIITYQRYPTNEVITDTVASFRPTYVNDPAIALGEKSKSEFSDKAFAGRTYTIPMVAELQLGSNSKPYKVEVWLANQSENYFRYNDTKELSQSVQGDPFAQPVQVYSNMSNGFGIFAGMATDVRSYY